MKKFILFVILFLNACTLTVGDFPEERQKLYNMGENQEGFCQEHPDRCVNGVPW